MEYGGNLILYNLIYFFEYGGVLPLYGPIFFMGVI